MTFLSGLQGNPQSTWFGNMDDSLFTINRYVGDDDNGIKQSVESEKKLLRKLRKEIALRRIARATESNNQEEKDLPGPDEVSSCHNSRKRWTPISSSSDHSLPQIESHDEVRKKRPSRSSMGNVGNASKKRKVVRSKDDSKPDEVEQDDTEMQSISSTDPANTKHQLTHKKLNTVHPFVQVGLMHAEDILEVPVNKPQKKKPKRHKKKSKTKGPEINGFTVLGKVGTQVSKKVKRVLPEWLTCPTVITVDLKHGQTSVEQLAGILHPKLLQELKTNGIVNFFPVQRTVIPWLLKSVGQSCYRSNDICVSAPTGSGKTLAFVLPIIQALLERVVVAVRALVILPVRELALQVYQVFHTYCQNTGLKVGLVVGKSTFVDEQKCLVRNSAIGRQSLVDIVVATPGKLVDHILKTPGFSLSQLRFLVIDEADRVMEEIKQDWLQFVEQSILSGRSQHDYISIPGIPVVPSTTSGLIPSSITPASTQAWLGVPQKLLFSATLSQNPEKLQALRLFQPKLFTSVVSQSAPNEATISTVSKYGEFLGKYTTPAELEEYFVECDKAVKPLVLYYLLKELGYRNILCFTNSVDTARRLYLLMKAMTELEVREVTARLIPSKQKKILTHFKQGKIDLIVCSDALARGMDFDNVKFVISYDSPEHIKTYIHRIGRTARAGKSGTAISFLDKKEVNRFQKFLIDAGKQSVKPMLVSEDTLEGYEEKFRSALQKVATIMKAA